MRGRREELLVEALRLLTAALELLDCVDAPGDIGARVDHACQRLTEILNLGGDNATS